MHGHDCENEINIQSVLLPKIFYFKEKQQVIAAANFNIEVSSLIECIKRSSKF
jgi:hypothetical protein